MHYTWLNIFNRLHLKIKTANEEISTTIIVFKREKIDLGKTLAGEESLSRFL